MRSTLQTGLNHETIATVYVLTALTRELDDAAREQARLRRQVERLTRRLNAAERPGV